MNQLNRLRLMFSTARYLSREQIMCRCRRIARRWWWQLRGRTAPIESNCRLAAHQSLYAGLTEVDGLDINDEELRQTLDRANAVAGQRFSFLNQRVDLSTHPGWHDTRLSQLWRYHLHYFDYVQDLLVWSSAGLSRAAYEAFRTLASSWINENQKFTGDGWHPFTISVRIVNWLHAVSAFEAQLQADEPFCKRLLGSLYGQAQVLAADLELDVRGNHLLKNLRGLLWAGVAFEGIEPQSWFQRAMELLPQELDEQVLKDGGHFERSPAYHLIVLKDCLEIGIWLRRNRENSPTWLDDAVRRMLNYLMAILPPGGQLPLLKDTAWDAAPAPSELLAAGSIYLDDPVYKLTNEPGLYCFLLFGAKGREKFRAWPINRQARGSLALAESNHFVMRDEGSGEYLILDAGKPCPDYLPAHAQADLLTYELSIDGQRIVVDSGVYEYAEGPWRDYFRSTRAHNTVEVAGENQSEVWGSFRVARRARPGGVFWQEAGGLVMLRGEHDGYSRLPVPQTHRRTVVWRRNHFWLIVDELLGKGETTSASYLHFHPNLLLEKVEDSVWRVQGCHTPLWVTAFGQQGHAVVTGLMEPVRQGWYSERFGHLQRNTVLTLHQQGTLPACYGYVIARHKPAKVEARGGGDGHQVNVKQGGHRYSFGLSGNAIIRFQ